MRCYLLAVCERSSIDVDTNNISLFNIVEEIQIAADAPAVSADFEVHAYWEFEAGELGLEHEVRFKISNGRNTQTSSVHRVTSTTLRLRMRSRGLGVPGSGASSVTIEYRRTPEGAWLDAGVRWPLQVGISAAPPT